MSLTSSILQSPNLDHERLEYKMERKSTVVYCMIFLIISMASSISFRVLYLPKENLTVAWPCLSALIELSTCDPLLAPLLHALPPEAQTPCKSKRNKNISAFSCGGKVTLRTVYKLSSDADSPLKIISGKRLSNRCFMYCLR